MDRHEYIIREFEKIVRSVFMELEKVEILDESENFLLNFEDGRRDSV